MITTSSQSISTTTSQPTFFENLSASSKSTEQSSYECIESEVACTGPEQVCKYIMVFSLMYFMKLLSMWISMWIYCMRKDSIFNKMKKYLLAVLVNCHCCEETPWPRNLYKKTFKGVGLVYGFREWVCAYHGGKYGGRQVGTREVVESLCIETTTKSWSDD